MSDEPDRDLELLVARDVVFSALHAQGLEPGIDEDGGVHFYDENSEHDMVVVVDWA